MMNRLWAKLVGALLLGFAMMGRSFAYIGVPAAKLFVGDIFLAVSLLLRPGGVVGRWHRGLISTGPLNRFSWIYLVFLQYGIIEALHGFSKGYDRVVILQELVFNIYPLYVFIGMEIGLRNPNFFRKLIRIQAWCTGIYGLAYIIALSRIDLYMPDTKVPVFGQTAGAFSLLGILCFERALAKFIVPLCLNGFVMLGMQVRAEWLGFAVGLTLWALLARRFKGLFVSVSVLGFLLLLGYATDFEMAAPRGRGAKISARGMVGRAVAVFDQRVAAEFTDEADSQAGTVTWRTRWWEAIWRSSHRDVNTAMFGHGYGFRIADLVLYLEGEELRTPHNDFYYALGYTGWVGVFLFGFFLIALWRLLWQAFRVSGQPVGVVLLGSALSQCFFGNLFETPFGAVPLYLLLGLAIAPVVAANSKTEVVGVIPIGASGVPVPATC
jgi:hypothetical protein